MKLTVLVDNNTYIDQYYLGEPAVSYYIEDGGARVLLDTGYSDIFLSNAGKMGIDLSRLTHIALSHGHNDHTGGLRFLLARYPRLHAELVAHPDCFAPKRDGTVDIGAPLSAEEAAQHLRYQPRRTPCALTERLLWLGEIPRVNSFEAQHPIGEQLCGGQWEGDTVRDDTALVYTGQEGLFIITGCSHSGICNIMEYAKQVTGENRVAGIIGGFHLLAQNTQLDKTVAALRAAHVGRLYPCHCVSLAAKASMLRCLPVEEVGVGLTLTIS